MSARPLRHNAARAAQRGMATTLVMLLTGMAITVTAMGMMYAVRSTQEQQMASHATVAAESRAWEGVELVRLYLNSLTTSEVTALTAQTLITNASGITAQIIGKETFGIKTQVSVNITGTSSLATSTLQVVYQLTPATSAIVNSTKALTFNGNLVYTGGSLSIVDGAALANIGVSGTLSVTNGAKALVSGCAKGGINMSGGGVADNAILLTEGTFSMSSSTPPNNLTLGAKSIAITQDGGSYLSIKAGGFTTNVISGGSTIGTAIVGGIKNADNSITALNSGTALITLTGGSVYSLDLSLITQSNNVITTTAGAKKISGSVPLPATISLTYNAVYGGDVSFKAATVNTFWGYTFALTGWGANYPALKAHGNVSILTAAIGQFQGGGNLNVQQYNTPTFASASQMAGTLRNMDGSVYSGGSITNLTTAVSTASPGLPGVPYCDLTFKAVDVTALQSQANYVFYFNGTTPMLKIQNIKKSDGSAVAEGPYNLATTDLRTLGGANFMICSYGNNNCGRTATPGTGWILTGITALPPGVLWFQGAVSFDGVQGSRLTNTVLATGNVTLTSSGHIPLYAPNFSGYSNVCTGSFWPTNLCNKSANPPALTSWTDSAGASHSGIPIGNVAIEAEGALNTSGWDIYGNVILGGIINTSGAVTNIKGGVSTGANTAGQTNISQGGIAIDVSSLTKDQATTDTTSTGATSAASTNVLWVRAL
ncbi:hypothetical protein IV02_31120 [Pseudomonas syringae]|uniref:Uncharacterized protein n=2 Tax=Pseudomonas syringae TaxID=317 RepID=A0A085UL39_PSESX|nr:hypothetical protein IV02_31120 [Pseudomonas syringae]